MPRHDFDALSFLFGLLFTLVGLVLVGGGAISEGLALPWAGPLVAVGLAILMVIAARPRPGQPASDDDDGAGAGAGNIP
jgi:hypothetical protein